MSKKKAETELVKFPKETFEEVYNRIAPLLVKYHQEQMAYSSAAIYPMELKFGLKELCFSCYTQGLLDGKQLNQ